MLHLGIDIDGTITENPEFFSILTKLFTQDVAKIHIISFRDIATRSTTEKELAGYGIRYDRLHLPSDSDKMVPWKLSIVKEYGIQIMFEDQPEILNALPDGVLKLWVTNFFDLNKVIKALS